MEARTLNIFKKIKLDPEIEISKTLHSYIVNGDIENVKKFLNSKTHHSQPYLNEKGKSSAFMAVECKQFDIYSLLLSRDIRFISDRERRILKELTSEENLKFNKALIRNCNEIKDAAVNFLLSNTKYVNNKNAEKMLDIKKYYEELNEIPEIGLVFSVIKCSGFVNIIFDFEMDSTVDIDQFSSSTTKGICHYEHGRIYIGAKKDHCNSLKGTIAHELTHYAMEIVYSNNCKPYHINDGVKKVMFNGIAADIQKRICDSECDIQFDEIIQFVFQRYYKSDWSSELIARVSHMLAVHGKENGEKLLEDQAKNLLGYYRENVMEQCKQFIRESYLLKPKSEVEILNLSSGLISRIQESAITFIQSLESELDEFIQSENTFLLISTPSSMLSVVKIFQSAKELSLNLSKYVLVECEKYLKQPSAIDNLLLSDSCILLIVNMSDNNCQAKSIDADLQQILDRLSAILKAKPKFKVAFIFDKNELENVVMQMAKHVYSYKLTLDVHLGITDLTKRTQNIILMKKVDFQGEQIVLKALITKNNQHLIDAKVLTNLIFGEKFEIGGKSLTKNYYNMDTYISREIQLDNGITMSEIELIEKVRNDKVIVISDIAGSGKSTLLTRIALLTKETFKDLWIVRINLNRFTKTFKQKLKKNNAFNSTEAVDFLMKSQKIADNSGFINEFFKSYIGKVVVMFDGFDEINPDYGTTVLNLVKATIEANVKQIWLTTRPRCQTMIKSQVQCESFKINPLTEENQLDFLVKFWKKSLKVEDKFCNLESFARQMRTSMFTYTDTFLANPLHLMMFADASLDRCKEFLQSSPSLSCIAGRLRKSDLYERFISKKFDVFQAEKLELDSSKIGANKFFSKEKLFEMHQIAALKLFFRQNVVEVLLSHSHVKHHDIDFQQIEMYGIITNFSHKRPEFVHWTFAEFLVATFIGQNTLQQRITKEMAEIILQVVFLKDNFKMIRSFLNDVLRDVTEMAINMKEFACVWEECLINEKTTPTLVAFVEENDGIVQFFGECLTNTQFKREFLTTDSKIGDSSLHFAAKMSNKKLVQILIDDYKVDVDVLNVSNETPLHVACKSSTTEIIKIFIDVYKANVDALNNDGSSLLHLAAEKNSKEVTKMLLDDYKADVNAVDNYGRTPMHVAASINRLEIIKILMDYSAAVESVSHYGNTPLHLAAENNGVEAIEMLINNGANVNAVNNYGSSPLHLATSSSWKQVIEMLIERGANVNAVNNFGSSPLHLATSRHCKELIKILIDHGANVDIVDNHGSTPLHLAAETSSAEVIQLLIEDCKANVNAINNYGNTPLYLAAANNSKEIIKMLIDDHQADANAVNEYGSTLLHWAATKNSDQVIKMLIEDYGANVNAVNNDDITPLHFAAKYNSKEVVKMLIADYGANVNAIDCEGNTPLHDAVVMNNKNVIKMLMDNGADITVVNCNGITPSSLANAKNNQDIIKILAEEYKAVLN